MSVPIKGNSLPNSGKELHPVPRRRRRATTYSMAVSEALKIQVNGSSHATKKLMRWTSASERTVKGWLSGTNGPCGEHLVELMEKSDEVWDSLRRLTKRPSIEVRHLVALKVSLEVALASIDAILDLSNGKGSQS
jgi:hypothetical protein